jgi:hypothetical protein
VLGLKAHAITARQGRSFLKKKNVTKNKNKNTSPPPPPKKTLEKSMVLQNRGIFLLFTVHT